MLRAHTVCAETGEMAKKGAVYTGRKKRAVILLSLFIVLGLVLSVERAVIDAFGQMWGAMLLNCMAILFSITGLLGICAKDVTIIIMYLLWNIVSIGLNVLVVLMYNHIGLLTQKEHYLGVLIGNDNYWRTHGIKCGVGLESSTGDENGMSSGNSGMGMESSTGDEGSGNYSGNGGIEMLEVALENTCLVSYSVIETIHAAIYMFIAMVSLLLCFCLLLCPRRRHQQISGYMNEDDEEFSYVAVAQRYDYKSPRKSFTGYL